MKRRIYIINATITPNDIFPFMASTAPTIHTATYPKLPIKFIIGIIRPDKHCALKALSRRFSFILLNSSAAFSSPLYALTTVCPVYISSICPLISPRCFCCLLKYFCDLPIIIIISANPNKDDSIAVTVIRTLVLNIINTEPKSKVTDDISIPTLILRDCPIISTSLVTLERISPVDVVL